MSKAIFPELYQNIENMKKELDPRSSALDNIILASFYSDHNIQQNAIECYEKAIQLAPDSDDYKKLYAMFLNKSGLTKEAMNVYRK